MKNKVSLKIFVLLSVLHSITAEAVQQIDGLWQQIDDKTGLVHSLLLIETNAGEVSASIVKGYPADGGEQDPNARCIACPGEFNNQPLYGLRLMWGLKGEAPDWSDGQILDPDEKKIYSVQASLSPDGGLLKVVTTEIRQTNLRQK